MILFYACARPVEGDVPPGALRPPVRGARRAERSHPPSMCLLSYNIIYANAIMFYYNILSPRHIMIKRKHLFLQEDRFMV